MEHIKISLKFDIFLYFSELKIAELVYKDRDINSLQQNNTTCLTYGAVKTAVYVDR
jgi:hypothetical protein